METIWLNGHLSELLGAYLLHVKEFFVPAVYRGQTDGELPLIPKAGRDTFYENNALYMIEAGDPKISNKAYLSDLKFYSEWRRDACAVTKELPENDFECLAYAQHYGLATRLLDWSDNPLVALFFAVESGNENGAVFVHHPRETIDIEKDRFDTAKQGWLLRVRPFDRRLSAQAGCFTYHSEPRLPLEQKGPYTKDNKGIVGKVIIPHEAKPQLRHDLDKLGFNRRTLFPDISGLSDYYNWKTATGLTVASFEKIRETMDSVIAPIVKDGFPLS